MINVTPFKLSQPLLLTNNTNSALLALQARFTRVDFQRVCHHLNGCPRLRLPKRLRTDLNSVKVGQRSLLGQSWQEHRELGKLLPNATNCTTFSFVHKQDTHEIQSISSKFYLHEISFPSSVCALLENVTIQPSFIQKNHFPTPKIGNK